MAPQKDFTIAIVGGGIAGLTLGIALHERGVPVDLYEKAQHFGEIGAGVSFSPNAVQAMDICGPGIYSAFMAVATHNGSPGKEKVWFDYYDGMADQPKKLFTINNSQGQNGLHRADFLDQLIKLFPAERAHFGKGLVNVEESASGKLELKFKDGTTAEADAVVGCDGIHSKVRKCIVGADHPSAEPTYTHKYAYRGLTPMEDAVAALGEEKARNSCYYLGKNGHVLTFPMRHGKLMNTVAFYSDPNEWTDTAHMTRWSTRAAALDDFKDFGDDVRKILSLTEPELNVWAIFDLGHPVPTFAKGRMVITGDAAHATSPHHGSGAGFAIEDSAVLAELLADTQVKTPKDVEAAFAAFDAVRRERDHWLVKSSRFCGEAVDGQDPEIGTEWAKFHDEIQTRYAYILGVNLAAQCEDARQDLHKRLA